MAYPPKDNPTKPPYTINQQRVMKVLDNIKQQIIDNPEDAEPYQEDLEHMLDNMCSQDFFGTEGQCDPRGDRREHSWSMWHVQGVDK
jgi:hypothetical protein